MWKKAIACLLGVGLLAFFAWGLHEPRLDLNDAEETSECVRATLGAGADPLQLQTLNAVGNGCYTGEAVGKDGDAFQVRVYPGTGGAVVESTRRDEQGEESRQSGLGEPALFTQPPAWFENLCGACLIGLLCFSTASVRRRPVHSE